MMQNLFKVLSIALQPVCFIFPRKIIFLIKFWKSQMHIYNTSLVEASISQFGLEYIPELLQLR